MAPFPYLEAAAGCTLLTYGLETLLDLRQYSVTSHPSMSPALEGVVSKERFDRARSYSLDKMNLHFVRAAVATVLELVVLLGGVLPWSWEVAEHWTPKWTGGGEIVHSIVFLGILHLWGQVVELPFSLYGLFVVESRHGFNKQTLFGFLKDLLIENLIAAVLAPPLVAAIIAVIKNGGPAWRLTFSLWLLFFVVQLALMLLYPIAIAPLFNKFTPLPEGPLRSKIEELASSLSFPLKKLLVVDGSARSAHSNAYLYGFFKSKRIVLYDTLLSQCKGADEQVVAVIAHELGHWRLSHTKVNFAASQLLVFFHFAAYAVLGSSPAMFRSFGFATEPIIIGLLLFQQVLAPLNPLLSWGLNALSRRFEFQADAFARQLGYAAPLRLGLIKLQEENLGTMATDPWYSTYHYSHPPLVERLAALDVAQKKEE